MTQGKATGAAAQRTRRKRSINDDNLTDIERDVLSLLLDAERPMGVREIALYILGPSVKAEAKGEDSVRTIRNALRIPKAMGLLRHTDSRGTYTVTETFRKFGFYAAEKTAEAWRIGRERRNKEAKEAEDES